MEKTKPTELYAVLDPSAPNFPTEPVDIFARLTDVQAQDIQIFNVMLVHGAKCWQALQPGNIEDWCKLVTHTSKILRDRRDALGLTKEAPKDGKMKNYLDDDDLEA